MSDKKETKKITIDLHTGYAYGLKLDEKGNCLAIQPLYHFIESPAGRALYGAGMSPDGESSDPSENFPYGKTLYLVDVDHDPKAAQTIYTVKVPKEVDAKKGVLPQLGKKTLQKDLVKAGLAEAPKAADPAAEAGIEDDAALAKALENINKMIGLDTAKRDIKQNIALARFNRMKEEIGLDTKPISRHMVFTGNPGTGKTTFAREVAKVYQALGFIEKAEVTEVKREDLVAGYVGQTALKTQEVIKKAKGGVLFIDEAYALSRDGGSDSKDFGREAIDTLVAAMENMRDDLIVIVAGYTEPMKRFIDANEGLKSRFTTYIEFQDYSMEDLTKIMDFMLKERGYVISEDARDHVLQLIEAEKSASSKDFGNGRTVRNVVEKAEKELAMRLASENKLSKSSGLTKEELKTALTTITFDDVKNISLKGIGGASGPAISFGGVARRPVVPSNNNGIGEQPTPVAKAPHKGGYSL